MHMIIMNEIKKILLILRDIIIKGYFNIPLNIYINNSPVPGHTVTSRMRRAVWWRALSVPRGSA